MNWLARLKTWLKTNFLTLGIIFLSIFIPLYPKFPLIDISHTWVYIRLEDVFVLIVVIAWLIKLVQRKVSLKTPLTIQIFFYWLVGGISLLFAVIFLRDKIANFFPNVALLHWIRRIEYMVLFFIAASTIKDIKTLNKYIVALGLTFFAVCLYGFGQKFLGFPAFLTMNEEFAKGIPIYLPPTARMTSTFAGHYDLAAYLLLMISLFGSLIFGFKKIITKIITFFLVLIGIILLLFTASRVSFAVYLLSISFMLFFQKKKWLILPVVLGSILLMNFLSGSSERFAKTFRVKQVVYDAQTGKAIAALENPEAAISPEEELPLGSSFLDIPAIETRPPEATKVAMIKRPTTLKTATRSSEIATISGEFLIKRAIVYDISFTTRFQGEWPRAIRAFERNPLLGSGFSSISLATDNDYLRLLGETGALGFIAFLSIFVSFGLLAGQALEKVVNPQSRSFLIGVSAGLLGLVFNAVLIDVFEASKVAYVLWIVLGISVGLIQLLVPKRRSLIKDAIKLLLHPIIAIIALAVATVFIFGSIVNNYFVGDDFTWIRWAVTSTVNDIPKFFVSSEGFFYRPLAKTYFLLAYSLFGFRPQGYHIFDILLHFGSVFGAYVLVYQLSKKKFLAFLVSLFFLISPLNSESVFWISSTSHLMASLFFIWGFVAYINWRAEGRRWLFYLLAVLAFILGLFSHEYMITFPLIIIIYELLFTRFTIVNSSPFIILSLAYLWLRNVVAQSHWLSGDYNYSLKNLPFNLFGNVVGYLGELIAGFNFIPFYDMGRSFLRSNKTIASGLLLLVLFVALLLYRLFKRLDCQKSQPEAGPPFVDKIVLFSICWFIVLLLPFLGLGNIAERYVHTAQLGYFLLLVLLISKLYKKIGGRNRLLAIILSGSIILGVISFYLNQIKLAKDEWKQAGETANKTLLAISSNYQEFARANIFFVNLPIRYGRAWVFPVGIEDGIWLVYRTNDIIIKQVLTFEEALSLGSKVTEPHIFIFENGELQEYK